MRSHSRSGNRLLYEKRATTFKDKSAKKFVGDFDLLKWEHKRRRVIGEQNGKCNRCNNDEWFGIPLTLEVDHIDGNNQNNDRTNLVALCPNCHSITPTFRGKNKGNMKLGMITDEQLINALRKTPQYIRQALIEVGLTPNGGNYRRANRLKLLMSLV